MKTFARSLLAADEQIPAGLKVWDGSDPSERYGIYRNAVIVSLIDALADTFRVTQLLVGEDFFRWMAREYVKQSPPQSPVLAHYGANFPEFISAFESTASLPYLADVSRLEYELLQAFHAEDVLPISTSDLSCLLDKPDKLFDYTFEFNPATRLIYSQFPIFSIWQAHQADGDFAKIDPNKSQSALIFRIDFNTRLFEVNNADANFISQLEAGHCLGQAYENCQISLNAKPDVASVISMLINTNSLTGIKLDTPMEI